MRFYTQALLIVLLLSAVMPSSLRGDKLKDELTDGGIALHVTNEFMSTIKTQVIETLINFFKSNIQPVSNTFDLSLFKFTYNLSDINLYAFGMDFDQSVIQFRKDEPHIHLEFIDFQVDLEFNYSLRADPAFYVDEGPGQVVFKFDNITIGMDVVATDEGVFQIVSNEVKAIYNGTQTAFQGKGDISYALNMSSALLNSSLVNDASKTIKGIVDQVLPLINGQIAKGGCTNDQSGLIIDWCAMSQPKFDDNSLSLIFKGEVRYDKDLEIPFKEMRKVPYNVDPTGKSIQISVSDYFLNTTIYSAFNLDILDYEMTALSENQTLTAATFKYLFPDITKHMSPTQPIAIRIHTNPIVTPYLEIIDGVTSGYGKVDISFAQANGDARDVFLEMTSDMNATVDLEIQDNFKLMTNIKQLKIKAQTLTLDKYQLTNLDDLNSMIGTISGFIRNYANSELSGYKNHVLDLGILKIDYKDTILNERERYIYFDSRPQFYTDVKAKEIMSRPVRSIEQKPVTYQDKVNALANLLKLTPIYKGIEQMKEHEQFYKNLAIVNPNGVPHASRASFEEARMPKENEAELFQE